MATVVVSQSSRLIIFIPSIKHPPPPNTYYTTGYHPMDLAEVDVQFQRTTAVDPKVVALGECGYDTHALSWSADLESLLMR